MLQTCTFEQAAGYIYFGSVVELIATQATHSGRRGDGKIHPRNDSILSRRQRRMMYRGYRALQGRAARR